MINVSMLDIVKAHARIKPYIIKTPLICSPDASRDTGGEIWFKMESLQLTGSFKMRGALNNILLMSDEELEKGAVAVSSGNHAQAVAYAAGLRKSTAVLCVPETTPMTKREGVMKYGGQLEIYGDTYDMAEIRARQIEQESGRKYIHGYESPETIAGQGTAALEALLQESDFDTILVPTGGGGLLCGTAIAAKAINPAVKVYGLQTDTSPPWEKSFKQKKLDLSCEFKPTCADGLEGVITWPNVELALTCVDDIIIVKEDSTRNGIKWMGEKHHYMIEGASATCLAALFENRSFFKGKKVLCMISGSNINLSSFCSIVKNSDDGIYI
ncbi:MAG: threonine/serine dehydratase [Firmicutes bacterium]|nr:threonine/serine dehydratase [Bacillota bacterium]